MRRNVANSLFAIIGAVVVLLLVLLPIWNHLPNIVSQYLSRTEVGEQLSNAPHLRTALAEKTKNFLLVAARSPLAWPFAIAAAVCLKLLRRYAILFTTVVCFIFATRVYHLRLIYLLPFVYFFLANGMAKMFSASNVSLRKSATFVAVASILAYASVSVIALTYAALPEQNSIAALSGKLKRAVALPNPKVYLLDSESELYHAGRMLNWKMYSADPRISILESPHDKLLRNFDVIAVTKAKEGFAYHVPTLAPAHYETLKNNGYVQSARIEMPEYAAKPVKRILAKAFRSFGYPSYEIWIRQPDKNQ